MSRCFVNALSFVAVFLVGCGGSQPPSGAPDALPQSRFIGQRITKPNLFAPKLSEVINDPTPTDILA